VSGALTLMLGEGSAGGGPGGALGALDWNNIYGPPGTRFATTNTLTISGITGSLTLSGSVSGPVGGALGAIKNGVIPFRWPAASITISNGDTLAWAINNFTAGDASGTATITRTDTGATVDSFTYFVQF
jgi:hypothetical protein